MEAEADADMAGADATFSASSLAMILLDLTSVPSAVLILKRGLFFFGGAAATADADSGAMGAAAPAAVVTAGSTPPCAG